MGVKDYVGQAVDFRFVLKYIDIIGYNNELIFKLYEKKYLIYDLIYDMGNWEKKQEEKQNICEREMVSKETLGKFFYDLSKLSFAALVIGSVASVVINKNNIDSWIIISIGAFVTYIFAYIGYKIIKQNR